MIMEGYLNFPTGMKDVINELLKEYSKDLKARGSFIKKCMEESYANKAYILILFTSYCKMVGGRRGRG
ncbi:MAG: hypothetical protein QW487_00235 [Candidatus Bathyarchaeia archaeon]|nr:hypothetical protein [Candidatus Bathyarchaeota archaeon]